MERYFIMSLIKNLGKVARKTIVGDEVLEKTVSPIVNKSVDIIDKTLNDNIKVPDVLGINVDEAIVILETLGFKVSVLEVRTANKKYAKYKVREVVDMEYPKPNIILKGIPIGSVIKIFIADEEIIKKSNSWTHKLFDNNWT